MKIENQAVFGSFLTMNLNNNSNNNNNLHNLLICLDQTVSGLMVSHSCPGPAVKRCAGT